MNILTRNDIKLNWSLVYWGLSKNWITPIEVTDAAYNGLFSYKITEDIIVQLEIKKDDEREFLNFICSLLTNERNDEAASAIWGIAFLLDIIKSEKPLEKKLVEVEILWAIFDYPDQWEPFIYFLPAKSDVEIGVQAVYKNLLHYIEAQKIKFGI